MGCGVSILGFNIFYRNYSLSEQLPNTKIAHYLIFWCFLHVAAASIEVGQRKKSSGPKSKKDATYKHNKCGYF